MRKMNRIVSAVLLLLVFYLIVSCVAVPLLRSRATRPAALQSAAGVTQQEQSKERVQCIDDNNEALIRRLQVIESAQTELIFASYNCKNDESGRDVMAALLHAADRGVRVRILVDGICVSTNLNRSKQFQALANSENVEVKVYNPINLLTLWRLNYRMHDKYIVADDDLYILGGRNTRNVSLGDYQDKKDIDRDILVYSTDPKPHQSLVHVKNYFESVWSLTTTKSYSGTGNPDEEILKQLRDYYDYMKNGCPEVFRIPDWTEETIPVDGITLLANPIEAENKAPVLWSSLCTLMENGKDVMIQTPYIICNQDMYADLTELNRQGRKLQIITNSVETGANPCGCADYLNQSGNIRKTGSEIYEFVGKNSSHTKTVLIDDHLSVIGSFNFDMRSTYLDTEMMLVIESLELNASLREKNQEYMDQSRCIHADGTITMGVQYEEPQMGFLKQLMYGVLRVIIMPFRHLL